MVDAGLLEWAVVDDYKADMWTSTFENLKIRNDLVLRSSGRIGFAIRENSPQLAAALNGFLKTHRQGTLKGNVLIKRYLTGFDWAKNALAAEDYRRFQDVVHIFEKFGKQYGVDYLMVAAQGYQESLLLGPGNGSIQPDHVCLCRLQCGSSTGSGIAPQGGAAGL